LRRVKVGEFTTTVNGDTPCPVSPLATHIIYAEGNMASIAEKIPIDISRIPGVMEIIFIRADCSLEEIKIYTELFREFCDVFSWSYEEIPTLTHIYLNMKSQLTSMLSLSHISFTQSILTRHRGSRLM
jgi:hypothetical protein